MRGKRANHSAGFFSSRLDFSHVAKKLPIAATRQCEFETNQREDFLGLKPKNILGKVTQHPRV
jgi:hypothetical protein